MEESLPNIQTVLFARLIFTFQSAAWQSLGKMADPLTGKTYRDLGQAKLAIDTLDMVRDKTKGNLNPDEERFLSQILSELKLNYVDEANRPDPTPTEPETESSTSSAVG